MTTYQKIRALESLERISTARAWYYDENSIDKKLKENPKVKELQEVACDKAIEIIESLEI